MSDRNEPAARETAGALSQGRSVWSARGIASSMTGVAVLTLVLGIAALVLAAVGRFPLIVLILAVVGLVCALRLFLPRVTTADKVLIPVGVVACLAALVILAIRIAQ